MSTNKKTLYFLFGILLFCALLTWLFLSLRDYNEQKAVEQEQEDVQVGRFTTLTDLQGNEYNLDATDGRLRVVGHFASWCPACLADLKVLAELSNKYEPNTIEFVQINRMESKEMIAAYFNEMKVTLDSKLTVVIDTKDTHFKTIGGFTMPETVIYGKNGEIVTHLRGPLDIVTIEQILNFELAQE